MSWQTPKTDWKPTDYFNYTDFNRIEGNVEEIASLLFICGFSLSLVIVTTRDYSTIDFYDSLNRIESNVQALVDCYGVAPANWIEPKTDWTFDVPFSNVDTNRMESNLNGLYQLVKSSVIEYPMCGQSLSICGLGWYN
ncbi:hypothetical protein DEAC_c23640 [Desulfosporosinus acididurans]|uniref:Uncharacterized protein n=1 Tax=Desulfosporosinus acididurans TaxID=476652 RepID=A0A0J1FQG5_9FIRM|nr:hypothetical protein [Desulfosporosinus acididurans]KLU65734.1 hypothetical protein DEAC_c23640 [Desulfosporosinus acididurans]